MTNRIVKEGEGETHVIRPEHISVADHFWNAFGNSQTEISARWIVRFCQKRGTWEPFIYEEIEGFYRTVGQEFVNFSFNNLLDKYILKEADGKYYVTHQFICICFGSSPAQSAFSKAVPA